MSFDLTVVPSEYAGAVPPIDGTQSEYDAWQQQWEAACLFDAPLGGDGTVYRYWSKIAHTVGLPLLAQMYESGLRLESAHELSAVALELDRIEAAWQVMDLPDPGPKSSLHGEVREHLAERLASFREAVRIAKEHGAVLLIT